MVLKDLKKNFQFKKAFIVCWRVKNSDKEWEHFLKVWDWFEIKALKYDAFLSAGMFENIRNKKLCLMCKSLIECTS